MDIVNWVNQSTIIFSILTILIIWGSFLYVGFRKRNFQTMFRSLTVLGLFFVWLFIIAIQDQLSSNSSLDSYKPTFFVGYIVFIVTLFSLWRVVGLHVGGTLRHLAKKRNYRLLMIYSAFTYSIFYMFTSGMITFTSSSTASLPKQGYIIQSQSYGPLSIWPNIEFWWPELQLFGVISIAGVLMVITLAGLIGISSGLVVYQWRLKRNWDLKVMGSTVGSGVAVTTTCFVSCALPAIYPILVILFGSATAEPLSRLLANQSGYFVNLLQMAVLSVMVGSVVYAGHRLRLLQKRR